MPGGFLCISIKPETDCEHVSDRHCFNGENLNRSGSEYMQSIYRSDLS
jgi:hypothetical protein